MYVLRSFILVSPNKVMPDEIPVLSIYRKETIQTAFIQPIVLTKNFKNIGLAGYKRIITLFQDL